MSLSSSGVVVVSIATAIAMLLVFSVCTTVTITEKMNHVTSSCTRKEEQSAIAAGPPVYEPQLWNSSVCTQSAHNCYSYALNDQLPELKVQCKQLLEQGEESCVSLRPKPGFYSGNKGHEMSCSALEERIRSDNPSVRDVDRRHPVPHHRHYNRDGRLGTCPRDFYKIAFAVKPTETYHFWRQDADGLWSHKDGGGPVRRTDESGVLISSANDPSTADRGQYNKFCKFLCVPNNGYRDTHMQP
jgi:hypothetical protein